MLPLLDTGQCSLRHEDGTYHGKQTVAVILFDYKGNLHFRVIQPTIQFDDLPMGNYSLCRIDLRGGNYVEEPVGIDVGFGEEIVLNFG